MTSVDLNAGCVALNADAATGFFDDAPIALISLMDRKHLTLYSTPSFVTCKLQTKDLSCKNTAAERGSYKNALSLT